MTVYGDILFIENFITGGVLLYITSAVFKEGFETGYKKLRLIMGCILCGLFSMVIFTPIKMPITFILEMAFAFAVCFIVMGKSRLWKKAAVFILVTYFMGGMTMGLLLVTQNTGIYTSTGIYTGDMKAAVLALFTAVFFTTARQIIKTIAAAKFYEEHSFDVEISADNNSVKTSAFLDTGNSLKDPITGRPVAVADENLWQELEAAAMTNPERFCMIPYEAIGSKGMLTATKVDFIKIKDSQIKNCIIARNDAAFDLKISETADYQLLLSKFMADGRL